MLVIWKQVFNTLGAIAGLIRDHIPNRASRLRKRFNNAALRYKTRAWAIEKLLKLSSKNKHLAIAGFMLASSMLFALGGCTKYVYVNQEQAELYKGLMDCQKALGSCADDLSDCSAAIEQPR